MSNVKLNLHLHVNKFYLACEKKSLFMFRIYRTRAIIGRRPRDIGIDFPGYEFVGRWIPPIQNYRWNHKSESKN